MRAIKRILVATDFSEQSEFAIKKALYLAEATKAHLTILHVAKKSVLENLFGKISTVKKVLITPEEKALLLLQKQVNKFSKNKFKLDYSILTGDHPGFKIIKYAKNNKTDLLIMGAHGRYSLHDWFVGTTAEYVVKKTICPVLIIKKPPQKTYKKILIPLDFSKLSKPILEFADRIFPKIKKRVLHVGDFEYEELLIKQRDMSKKIIKTTKEAILALLTEKLKNIINASHVHFKKLAYSVRLGNPSTIILDEAKKHIDDLILMGTEGHGSRYYLFIGRVASRVLMEADRDILLIPPTTLKKLS